MILTVGLDIAKEKIDIYWGGKYGQIKNNKSSIKTAFKPLSREHRVLMEATGKYHRLAHRVLEEMGFTVMVVNPFQSKHFAKAMNLLCKTDKVDAKMLASFAQRMEFKPTHCATQDQEKMQDLSRHLDDLKKTKKEFDLRLKESSGFIKKSIRKTIDTIKKEIEKTEKELKGLIASDPQEQRRLDLLMTIPGIGERTAICLLSYMKEIGHANKRQIAALAGLAPMNNDSGKFSGKRRIRGGRHDVRSQLYMPVLGAATQYNQRLKAMYDRLVDNGKPKKVALTACMRKLIVWANAILITGQPWQENYSKNS